MFVVFVGLVVAFVCFVGLCFCLCACGAVYMVCWLLLFSYALIVLCVACVLHVCCLWDLWVLFGLVAIVVCCGLCLGDCVCGGMGFVAGYFALVGVVLCGCFGGLFAISFGLGLRDAVALFDVFCY